jgi:hypothetical protein
MVPSFFISYYYYYYYQVAHYYEQVLYAWNPPIVYYSHVDSDKICPSIATIGSLPTDERSISPTWGQLNLS